MVLRSLDVKKDPFCPHENDKELFGLKAPYLSAMGALMYFTNITNPEIAFAINLLARLSSSLTHQHC